MKLKCPRCKKEMSWIGLTSHFANNYQWNEQNKQYELYTQCPDQGEHALVCGEHGCNIEIPNTPVENITQELLDEHGEEED